MVTSTLGSVLPSLSWEFFFSCTKLPHLFYEALNLFCKKRIIRALHSF